MADKYRNNYSETQKLAMEQVYCRGDCPNSERFKVICNLNLFTWLKIISEILILFLELFLTAVDHFKRRRDY